MECEERRRRAKVIIALAVPNGHQDQALGASRKAVTKKSEVRIVERRRADCDA
jgi:hypothetical protein